MKKYLANFKLGEVDVLIHISTLFSFFYLILFINDLNMRAIIFAFLVLLVLLHELGHMIVAKIQGIKVFKIELYFNGGICVHEKTENELKEIFIAWGGVIAQFILLLICIVLQYILVQNNSGNNSEFIKQTFEYANYYNIFGIIYNLLPYKDLDGTKAWKILNYTKLKGLITKVKERTDRIKLESIHGENRLRKREILKAFLFSIVTSIVSAIIWYVFVTKTGYQVGLISMAIGFLIARSVIYGSGGKVGKIFQAIGIVSLLISMVLSSFLLMKYYLSQQGYDVYYLMPVKTYFTLTFEYFKADPVSILFWIFGLFEIIKICGVKGIPVETQE